jgi:hypothetical protein
MPIADQVATAPCTDPIQESFVRTSRLETVSTVRGSGWVAVPKRELLLIINMIASPIRYRGRY